MAARAARWEFTSWSASMKEREQTARRAGLEALKTCLWWSLLQQSHTSQTSPKGTINLGPSTHHMHDSIGAILIPTTHLIHWTVSSLLEKSRVEPELGLSLWLAYHASFSKFEMPFSFGLTLSQSICISLGLLFLFLFLFLVQVSNSTTIVLLFESDLTLFFKFKNSLKSLKWSGKW